MTTITYRDGIMAGDRRISDTGRGLIEGGTTKIFRREDDGALIGVAGSLGVAQRFARWFLAGEQGEMPPLRDKDANATAEAIVVRPNGKVENIYELGTIYIESDYHAIGSGSIAALAAMDMGADARRAVEIACGRDAGTGNGIDELHLNRAVIAVLQPAQPPALTTVSDSGEGERPAREETKAFVRDILENTFGQQTTDEQVEDVAQQIDALAPPAPEVRKEDEQDAAGEQGADWFGLNAADFEKERDTLAEAERAYFDRGYEAGLAGIETDGDHPNAYHEGWGLGDHTRVMAEIEKERASTASANPPQPQQPATPIPEGFTAWPGEYAGFATPPLASHQQVICWMGGTDFIGPLAVHEVDWACEPDPVRGYKLHRDDADKPLIVDDTPTIPRSEIPQGAAVDNPGGEANVFLQQAELAMNDKGEDEPATPEQLEAEGITEPGASELAAMRMAPETQDKKFDPFKLFRTREPA